MIYRYPHTATIITVTETDNGTGIPETTDTEIELQGRYEPAGQNKTLDYSAKFYCRTLDIIPFEVDGQRFIYEGKQFTIAQLHRYQSHTEIWLE